MLRRGLQFLILLRPHRGYKNVRKQPTGLSKEVRAALWGREWGRAGLGPG